MKKRLAIFAVMAATIAVAGTATASQQGNAGPTPELAQVTVIHAATFSADSEFTVTVCANGAIVDDAFEVGQQLGPIPLPAGDLEVAVFGGTVSDCSGTPAIGGTFPVEAGDDFAIVAVWGPNGPTALTFDYDRSCVDPGEARVAAVHAAAFADDSTVDVWAGPAGGDIAPLIPGFELNTYAGPLTVPAGAYDVAVFPAGADPTGTPAIAVDGLDLAEGTSTVIYAIGGNDGPLGAFALVDTLPVCEVPTEPTTPTDPTDPPAEQGTTQTPPPATPVAGNANFTG